jgi:hypothetical protein
MSFGILGATDRNRYRFLSGFKLNDQGKNEDPTYLGFSIDFDFSDGIDSIYGTPISPLFKDGSYINTGSLNIFGQLEYSTRNTSPNDVLFYSAQSYLVNREFESNNGNKGFGPGGGKRSQMIKQFKILLRDVSKNQPWFFQSISGLDELYKVTRPGYQDEDGLSDVNPSRAATITVNTLESLNLRITALADLYNHATFDYINMRETVPRNLRRFRMYIYVTDLRNFFKTNRLTNSSTTLSSALNLANLVGSGINPGSSLNGNTLDSTSFPGLGENSGSGSGLIGAGQEILRSEGLSNQQDQSGIKPIIVIECSNCEFDFSESSPIGSDINAGTDSGEPLGQSFKIHVGRVRIRSQYPNIRLDKKPMIISDDTFTEKSSVQIYEGDPSGRTIFGVEIPNGPAEDLVEQAINLGTNLIGNTVNDLYDRGAQFLSSSLNGADQLLLGNIYSSNPSLLTSNLILNTIKDFSNPFSSNASQTQMQNPKNLGQGGPPENKYPSGDLKSLDEYTDVPGKDLGVSPKGSGVMGRVYPSPGGDLDSYDNVPGPDLGVPGRVYPSPGGDLDSYDNVPGPDLGVPGRVYPNPPKSDAYPEVPGKDLGSPKRTYPEVKDDFYPDVPGVDLGGTQRVYPNPEGDVYPDVPGKDLGSPDRVYPGIKDDVYRSVPGRDLGVPDRSYPVFEDDFYPDVPGKDLGLPERRYPIINDNLYPSGSEVSNQLKSPERVYKEEPEKNTSLIGDSYGDPKEDLTRFTSKPSPVYPREEVKYFRGNLGDLYPPTAEDFNPDSPGDLGNLKPKGSYNISLGGKNPDPSKFNE